MANPGVIMLIILVITISIIVIVIIIFASVYYTQNTNNGNNGGGGGSSKPPCSQGINISTLIQIPDSAVCKQNGVPGSLYYIGNLGNLQYDYVVAPWGTQPLDVCVGFCTVYSNGICTGPPYNGASAQVNFDRCITQLSSTTCAPPIPIAAKGAILYYAFSPTCNICDGCRT